MNWFRRLFNRFLRRPLKKPTNPAFLWFMDNL